MVAQSMAAFVRARADGRCEYCHIPDVSETPFQIDHIIAIQHGGPTEPENLALSCFYCNSVKGPNIASIDPETGEITRLFHPRRDAWQEHFEWHGTILFGRTDVGRTTIRLLQINEPLRVLWRHELRFPPR